MQTTPCPLATLFYVVLALTVALAFAVSAPPASPANDDLPAKPTPRPANTIPPPASDVIKDLNLPINVPHKRDCVHVRTTFRVPCDKNQKICYYGSSLQKWHTQNLTDSAKAWLEWIKVDGNGRTCNGTCSPIHQEIPEGYIGATWMVVCLAARVRRATATGIPAEVGWLQRIDEWACDVHCGLVAGRTCKFKFGKCKP